MSPLYFVMFVALAICLALFAYVWRRDARVCQIQRRLSSESDGETMDAPEAVLEPGVYVSLRRAP